MNYSFELDLVGTNQIKVTIPIIFPIKLLIKSCQVELGVVEKKVNPA